MRTLHRDPSLAQLVERRTVVEQSILRSLVRIRQLGRQKLFFPQKLDPFFMPSGNGLSSF